MQRVILALYVLATSLALVLLKLGARHGGAPVQSVNNKLQFNLSAYVLGGVVLYGISFVLYTYLISRYDLGYIVPLTTALVYICIFTASYFIFHEAFTAFKIAGIFLIVAGLSLLNIK
jgi:drug/metabolite transporter (DMT)-like permease